MKLTENKNLRSYSQKSINWHSCRFYAFENEEFMIDKTTDACPPFFTLYAYHPELTMLNTPIPVNGDELWGDGLSWKKAEKLAELAIRTWFESDDL